MFNLPKNMVTESYTQAGFVPRDQFASKKFRPGNKAETLYAVRPSRKFILNAVLAAAG
jgi:hypothetical protein